MQFSTYAEITVFIVSRNADEAWLRSARETGWKTDNTSRFGPSSAILVLSFLATRHICAVVLYAIDQCLPCSSRNIDLKMRLASLHESLRKFEGQQSCKFARTA